MESRRTFFKKFGLLGGLTGLMGIRTGKASSRAESENTAEGYRFSRAIERAVASL